MKDHETKTYIAESAFYGHPDRLADLISDCVIDLCLRKEPESRVKCHVAIFADEISVMGKYATSRPIDFTKELRAEIGKQEFIKKSLYLPLEQMTIRDKMHHIRQDGFVAAEGVSQRLPSNDQCLIYGYATDETKSYMPLPTVLAKLIADEFEEARLTEKIPFLLADGNKAMVSVKYDKDIPVHIDGLFVSLQVANKFSQEILEDFFHTNILSKMPQNLITEKTRIKIDTYPRNEQNMCLGFNGKNIVIDAFGGVIPVGGGSFSGKDGTRIDRLASYYARYMAKNLVAAGLYERCQVFLSYVFGETKPACVEVDGFGTEKIDEKTIQKIIPLVFDPRPGAMYQELKMHKVNFVDVTKAGHFGDSRFTWEKLDKVSRIREYLF